MEPPRQNAQSRTYITIEERWVYFEGGKKIKDFTDESEMAQYLHISDTPKHGVVKTVYEDDFLNNDFSGAIEETSADFLDRYAQYHPLIPPRDKKLQERLRQTRYVLRGEESTAKDLWERCYRSQIDNLIRSGVDNYIAALVLMLPCMELVYELKTGKSKQDWTAILKMFFPVDGFDDNTYMQLKDLIRNGFVHDGFARANVRISAARYSPEEYMDGQHVFEGVLDESGQFHLVIVPTYFWARVRDKIDSFYKYEQWIPGWDMVAVPTLDN